MNVNQVENYYFKNSLFPLLNKLITKILNELNEELIKTNQKGFLSSLAFPDRHNLGTRHCDAVLEMSRRGVDPDDRSWVLREGFGDRLCPQHVGAIR